MAMRGETDGLTPLVAALTRRVDVRSWGQVGGSASAVLAVGPGAAARAAASSEVPVAVVSGDRIEMPGGDSVPFVRDHAVRCAAWPPLAPAVRLRWRERLGLASDLVVDTAAVATEDVPTALAVAAAAVVDLRHLPLALALGCPTVTDAAALAAVGAVDGDHALVGERTDAVDLAGDVARCARLSRRARGLAEHRLDPERTARRLLSAWGLARLHHPATRLDANLDDLGTAPGARPRRRAHAAIAMFGSPDPAGGT